MKVPKNQRLPPKHIAPRWDRTPLFRVGMNFMEESILEEHSGRKMEVVCVVKKKMCCEERNEAGSNTENVAAKQSWESEPSARCYWLETPHLNLQLPWLPIEKSKGLLILVKVPTNYSQISWLGTWNFRTYSLTCCTNEINWEKSLIWLEKAEVALTYQHIPLRHISGTVQLDICQNIISNIICNILKSFKTRIFYVFQLVYHRRMTWNSSPISFLETFSNPSPDQQLLPKEIYELSK